jgi:catechol 2,3-dioxygenase-like lactoylglutathione lyase family enzyme
LGRQHADAAAVIGKLRPAQVAYHVPDPEAAAERCAREFGWGPFFLLEHVELERCAYRGSPTPFDHTSAYGQAGEVMVELITQHNDAPSALRDLYAPQESGLHHVACFVDDLGAELRRFQDRGVAIALEARTRTGVDFAMVDLSATLGHMLELYEPGDDLRGFYAYVRKCADGWTGDRPVRRPRRNA